MIRVVLVERSMGDWRIYRQPRWMAEVRRDPGASQLPRLHFDIDEEALDDLLDDWVRSGSGSSRESAVAVLTNRGAVEVIR